VGAPAQRLRADREIAGQLLEAVARPRQRAQVALRVSRLAQIRERRPVEGVLGQEDGGGPPRARRGGWGLVTPGARPGGRGRGWARLPLGGTGRGAPGVAGGGAVRAIAQPLALWARARVGPPPGVLHEWVGV